MSSSGFQLIDSLRLLPSGSFRKYKTDCSLMVMKSVFESVAVGRPQDTEWYNNFEDTFHRALQETQKGVSIGEEMIIVVGRKALE